jgi:hypothetical protein
MKRVTATLFDSATANVPGRNAYRMIASIARKRASVRPVARFMIVLLVDCF